MNYIFPKKMFSFHLVFVAALALAALSNSVYGQEKKEEAAASADSKSKQPQSQAIVEIDFAKQYSLFNPKNDSSLFKFYFTPLPSQKCADVEDSSNSDGKLMSDNAAFVFGGPNFINMASLPFGRWVSQRGGGVGAAQAAYDATLQLKGSPMPLSANDILQARLLFACETFGTAEHPFPADAVTDAQDDPRLASSSMFLSDLKSGIEFGFVLTNRGVWAAYNRSPRVRFDAKQKYRAFQVYRRLGNRGVNDFIDARIAVNGAAGATRYYVDNQVVWSVADFGMLSSVSADKNNTVVYEYPGNDETVKIESMTFFINNEHKMDQADPNRSAGLALKDSKALVKLTDAKDYYGPDMKFYDENSMRASSLFNQGAKMSLSRLRIEMFPTAAKQ